MQQLGARPPSARQRSRTGADGRLRIDIAIIGAAAHVALIGVRVLPAAFRYLRGNFTESWCVLGFAGEAALFAWYEVPVAAATLVALALPTLVTTTGAA